METYYVVYVFFFFFFKRLSTWPPPASISLALSGIFFFPSVKLLKGDVHQNISPEPPSTSDLSRLTTSFQEPTVDCAFYLNVKAI